MAEPRFVASDQAPKAIGPYSQAVIANGFLYSAGQIALDPGTMELVAGDVRAQTERVLLNLEAVLREAGSSLQRVVKTTVYLTDLGAFAAVNLAGPEARRVMELLTEGDVSAEGFPYMACRQMEVAGVPSIVLRVGFVGELSYEIHFPSMFGLDVWDRMMQAGDGFGVKPFGLEAQRILRLEKQHILVGQDTDAESDPYEVGLGWMVKLDKPDFLGKRSLLDLSSAQQGERLVGWTSEPPIVPPEGSSVVHEGVWVGRVTSARRRRAAGTVVGLAWVPSGWAEDGRSFDIQFGSVTVHAKVHLEPFYDPSGARLRS